MGLARSEVMGKEAPVELRVVTYRVALYQGVESLPF